MTKLVDTLYITEHGTKVGVEKSAIVVSTAEGRTRVPMEGLERIVLLGRTRLTDDAAYRCSQRGIRIASLNRSGRLRYSIGFPTSGNVLLRVAQLRAADDVARSLSIAKTIVAAKVLNSALVLHRWANDASSVERRHLESLADYARERLAQVDQAATHDQLRGVEGDAARAHFKGLGAVLATRTWTPNFSSRNRRPPRDPVNAALSFGYGLITIEVQGALEAAGLDPQVGFLHGLRPGRPSLALDLVEELRAPIVDRFVIGSFSMRRLRETDHFIELPGGAWRLSSEGNRAFLQLWEANRERATPHPLLGTEVPVWSLPHTQATLLARTIRGDLDAYPAWVAVR